MDHIRDVERAGCAVTSVLVERSMSTGTMSRLDDEIEDEGRSDTDGYSRRAKAGRSLTRLPCVLRLCAVQESR